MSRRALVLGGSGHVGSAVVRELGRAGAEATFTYHRGQDRALVLEAETGARGRAVDLADRAAVRALFAELEREGALPDVLVHCAAIAEARPLDAITDVAWDAMHRVNVESAFVACQELARRPAEGPRDVVLTAALDGIQSIPAPAHFAATQAARLGLVRALSKELGPRRIRVNLVALGVLDGGISRDLSPEHHAEHAKWSALGRGGSAVEAARAIRWLALESTYMTGAMLSLTGGL